MGTNSVSRSANPDSSGRVPRSLVENIILQHSCGMAAPLNHKDVVTRIRSEKIPATIPDKDQTAHYPATPSGKHRYLSFDKLPSHAPIVPSKALERISLQSTAATYARVQPA
jgi:hypothetical protein